MLRTATSRGVVQDSSSRFLIVLSLTWTSFRVICYKSSIYCVRVVLGHAFEGQLTEPEPSVYTKEIGDIARRRGREQHE